MGELGQALALMHGARDRVRSLRATIRISHDHARARRALEWFAQTPAGRQSGYAEDLLELDADGERPPTEEEWRLWIEKPDRLREERDRPGRSTQTGVRVGDLWWRYDSEYGPHSNEA